MVYPDDGKPIRLRCLEAIKDALEGIRRSSGDYSDMAAVYILQSEKIVTGTPMPVAVIVDDGIDERIDENLCQVTQAMPLSLFLGLRAVGGSPWTEEIAWLVSDVEKAIDADPQLATNALYTDVVGKTIFEAPVDSIVSAEVKIRVVYRQASLNPAAIS